MGDPLADREGKLLRRIAELESQVEAACASPAGCDEQRRIAELEAENERLRLHQDWLRDDTLVSQLDTINRQAGLWKAERKRAEQAEAALAERDRQWEDLRGQMQREAKHGIDLCARHDANDFLKMMARAEEGRE